jgi:putative endonuclease
MYYVYILKSSKNGKIYTGYTSDLKRRVLQHKIGKVRSTTLRRPLKLIYYEAYSNKVDAQVREKYLKGGGKAKNLIKDQIKNSLI